MPTIPEGYGEMAFIFRLTGDPQDMLVTIGFGTNDILGPVQAALMSAAVVVESEFNENVVVNAANMTVGWSYHGAKYTIVSSDAGRTQHAIPRSITGTFVGETLPANNSWLIQKRTNTGGRTGRGRMYLPIWGINEAGVSKLGVIDSASVSGQQTRFNDWLSEVNADLNEPFLAVLHNDIRIPGPPVTYIPNPETPYEITQFVVDSVIATQRRRLRP